MPDTHGPNQHDLPVDREQQSQKNERGSSVMTITVDEYDEGRQMVDGDDDKTPGSIVSQKEERMTITTESSSDNLTSPKGNMDTQYQNLVP